MQHTNDKTFHFDIAGRDILVVFSGKNCGACHELMTRFRTYNRGFIKADVDDCPKTAAAHSVRALPTTLVIKNGQVVKSIVGIQPLANYEC